MRTNLQICLLTVLFSCFAAVHAHGQSSCGSSSDCGAGISCRSGKCAGR